jgi:hypothetical protein
MEEHSAQVIRFLLFSTISPQFHSQTSGLWLPAIIIKDSLIGIVYQTMLYGARQISLQKIYGLSSSKTMVSFQGGIIT